MSNNQSKFIKDILEKSAYYKSQMDKISTDTLSKIAVDRQKALEIARKVIEEDNSMEVTDELVSKLADLMQDQAKVTLEERSKPL